MNNYIIIAILLIVLYFLYKPDISYKPSQEEIQSENYVDVTKSVQDFPYPQLSRTFKKLSRGESILPSTDESLPDGKQSLEFVRTDGNARSRMYLPDYHRKDRLSGDTLGSEEYRPFLTDNIKSENSWTDTNVSEHPKFYNSEVKDDLTNIGSFFDKNNNYSDKTTANSEPLVSDSCYKDRFGNQFCEDNTRLQNIPPKLMSDPNSPVLNTIGFYKDNNRIDDMKDKLMNGGTFYNNIKGSMTNETFSSYNNNPLEISISF
jgi:hypothetical protein